MTVIIMYLLINLLVGVATCFFGKRLYFPILMLSVFGAVIALSLAMFDWNLMVGVLTFVVAALFAIIAYYFYKVGVFIIGGILGGSLSIFVISLLPSCMLDFSWILAIILILTFGVCAVKWCDFFIVVSTSFNGAFTIATGLFFILLNFNNLHNFVYIDGAFQTVTNLNQYINNEFVIQHAFIIFIITMIIAFIGVVYQTFHCMKAKCK